MNLGVKTAAVVGMYIYQLPQSECAQITRSGKKCLMCFINLEQIFMPDHSVLSYHEIHKILQKTSNILSIQQCHGRIWSRLNRQVIHSRSNATFHTHSFIYLENLFLHILGSDHQLIRIFIKLLKEDNIYLLMETHICVYKAEKMEVMDSHHIKKSK